ncbi:hypothetical protein [Acinetobacter sp.]|jgi:hypothetical protein|uniref:hypothetical protein n=1 Tax=Acinetobacter sp. TaxID=472 RepID=UPI0035B3574B
MRAAAKGKTTQIRFSLQNGIDLKASHAVFHKPVQMSKTGGTLMPAAGNDHFVRWLVLLFSIRLLIYCHAVLIKKRRWQGMPSSFSVHQGASCIMPFFSVIHAVMDRFLQRRILLRTCRRSF